MELAFGKICLRKWCGPRSDNSVCIFCRHFSTQGSRFRLNSTVLCIRKIRIQLNQKLNCLYCLHHADRPCDLDPSQFYVFTMGVQGYNIIFLFFSLKHLRIEITTLRLYRVMKNISLV